MPSSAPRALSCQCGASRPLKAGTKYTPAGRDPCQLLIMTHSWKVVSCSHPALRRQTYRVKRSIECGFRVSLQREAPENAYSCLIRQQGTKRIKDGPAVSGTEDASASLAAAESMMPRLSRNHETPAPATAMLPSSAYCASACRSPHHCHICLRFNLVL